MNSATNATNDMSAEDNLQEVATILVQGYLLLVAQDNLKANDSVERQEKAGESPDNPLALHGHLSDESAEVSGVTDLIGKC